MWLEVLVEHMQIPKIVLDPNVINDWCHCPSIGHWLKGNQSWLSFNEMTHAFMLTLQIKPCFFFFFFFLCVLFITFSYLTQTLYLFLHRYQWKKFPKLPSTGHFWEKTTAEVNVSMLLLSPLTHTLPLTTGQTG